MAAPPLAKRRKLNSGNPKAVPGGWQVGPIQFAPGPGADAFARASDRAMAAAQHGTGFDEKRFAGGFRVDAAPEPFGGSGQDENVSTALTKRHAHRLVAAKVRGLDVDQEIRRLSMFRTPTLALVWHTDEGEIGGHPGALRAEASSPRGVVHGHGRRDRDRRAAVETEFKTFVPNLATASASDVQRGNSHMAVRAQIETINRFSQPWETFQKRGRTGKKAVHARYGDISSGPGYDQMAAFVHNEREASKWLVAWEIRDHPKLSRHIPAEMAPYLRAHRSAEAARAAFDKDAASDASKRVNAADTSQAERLNLDETLADAAGRKRALSPPRRRQ